MKGKKLISALLSAFLLGSVCNLPLTNAAVIEPEIVKTETWTTSYYIDDDESTTYPYIDCQADIYSDGTVKCYFWNTHEWDGFATVSHTVTILSSQPYCTDSVEYSFYKGNTFTNQYGGVIIPLAQKMHGDAKKMTPDFSFWKNRDISFYPKEYKKNTSAQCFFHDIRRTKFYSINTYYDISSCEETPFQDYSVKCALSLLPVNKKSTVIFNPIVDPVDTYTIRFLGHDITVSPDILSSNIVATPQLSEQEKYIAELEKKNAELTEEIAKLKADPSNIQNSISRLDADGDNAVTSVDASIILWIYAYNSTHDTQITTFDEYNALKQE